MKIIGITGGIGSGKSTFCKLVELLGYPVYYADERGRWLTNNTLKTPIISLLGAASFQDGQLNRSWVAKQVFSDKSLLQKLNAIIHPAVAEDFKNWMKAAGKELVFYEAALIYENGSQDRFDQVVLVTAPEEIRVSRVLQRDKHRTEQDIKKIIANQLAEEEKRGLADHVVENDGQHSMIAQAVALIDRLVVAEQ